MLHGSPPGKCRTLTTHPPTHPIQILCPQHQSSPVTSTMRCHPVKSFIHSAQNSKARYISDSLLISIENREESCIIWLLQEIYCLLLLPTLYTILRFWIFNSTSLYPSRPLWGALYIEELIVVLGFNKAGSRCSIKTFGNLGWWRWHQPVVTTGQRFYFPKTWRGRSWMMFRILISVLRI